MDHRLAPAEIAETLRLLERAVPHIGQVHLAEALTRGLGQAGGSVDRAAFEESLADAGFQPKRLQVTLLADAVRIATGTAWRLSPRPPGKGLERCTHCRDDFWSDGPHNLVCSPCKARSGSVPGVHHAAPLCDQMVYRAFHFGIRPNYAGSPLRARPGWADVLDDPAFQVRVAVWLDYRDAARSRRWDDLPDGQRFLISRFGETSYLRLFRWEPEARRQAA
jgi:hypothetical protein